MAVGIMAIGMIFIGGVFPVAIHFTTIATERSIAAVVADEAFAKVRLIAADPCRPISADEFAFDELTSFEQVADDICGVAPETFAYPSDPNIGIAQKKYFWSALCRRVDLSNVQVTVFVCRRTGSGTMYVGEQNRPVAVPVAVSGTCGDPLLTISNPNQRTFINDGCTIVDNKTGQLYRVLKRNPDGDDRVVLLDTPWWDPDDSNPSEVWVIPPPTGGGRYPCIAIYQQVIRF